MDYLTATFANFSLRQGELTRNAFKRLAKNEGWSQARRAEERRHFHKSIVQDLNERFNKLEHYQDLCQKLFEDKLVPGSITQCKKLLNTKYVNIWDIFEERYRYFDDYEPFRRYTRKGRMFDRQEAKKLFLNVFLEHV